MKKKTKKTKIVPLILISILCITAFLITNLNRVNAITVPSGILDYVAITLTNNQDASISSGTQISINIDWNIYSSYLDNPVDNYAFFDSSGNLLYSWLENGTANTSNYAVVWVVSDSSISSSGGTWTCYLGFYALGSNQLSSTGYTGEYPTATGTYAQYDNGAKVFTYYQNWIGTSAPSSWTITGDSVSISNGATMTSSNNAGYYYYKSSTSGSIVVESDYEVITQASTSGYSDGFNGIAATALSWTSSFSGVRILQGTNPTFYYMGAGGSTSTSTTTTLNTFNIIGFSGNSTYMTYYDNYTLLGTKNTAVPSAYYPIGAQLDAGAKGLLYWFRTRTYVPNSIMPSSNFGSITAVAYPPTYSGISTSNNAAGQSCIFSITWSDNIGLASTGGYIFGSNITGTFINQTLVAFSSNPQTVSVTQTLPSSASYIEYEWWAEDISGLWTNTGLQTLTVSFSGWGEELNNIPNNGTSSINGIPITGIQSVNGVT